MGTGHSVPKLGTICYFEQYMLAAFLITAEDGSVTLELKTRTQGLSANEEFLPDFVDNVLIIHSFCKS